LASFGKIRHNGSDPGEKHWKGDFPKMTNRRANYPNSEYQTAAALPAQPTRRPPARRNEAPGAFSFDSFEQSRSLLSTGVVNFPERL